MNRLEEEAKVASDNLFKKKKELQRLRTDIEEDSRRLEQVFHCKLTCMFPTSESPRSHGDTHSVRPLSLLFVGGSAGPAIGGKEYTFDECTRADGCRGG